MIAIDASVAIAWSLLDERDEVALATSSVVGRDGAIVPALWCWEIQQVLRTAERRKRTTHDETRIILESLQALPIEVEAAGPRVRFGAEFEIARRYDLSVYDALYLELAQRRGLRLATKDPEFAEAALAMALLWQP